MAQLRFRSSIPAELHELLRREYREYAAETTMTDDEHTELCKWVAQGNSPYGNPGCIADESGHEMDFISALRAMDGLAAEIQTV